MQRFFSKYFIAPSIRLGTFVLLVVVELNSSSGDGLLLKPCVVITQNFTLKSWLNLVIMYFNFEVSNVLDCKHNLSPNPINDVMIYKGDFLYIGHSISYLFF